VIIIFRYLDKYHIYKLRRADQMSRIEDIQGPDDNGNYRAKMDDGTVVTFGPAIDQNYPDYWFVSIGDGYNKATYVIPMFGKDRVLQEVNRRGTVKSAWREIAISVIG
jgi:hypothetical protein